MLRIGSTVSLAVAMAFAVGPVAVSQSQSRPPASVVCLSKIDVGEGADPYKTVHAATAEGQLVCPFVGSRAEVITPLAGGECADLKFGALPAQSRAVSKQEAVQVASCLAIIAPTRKIGIAGTVQAIEVQRPKSDVPDPLDGQITRALLRTGLPVSAYQSVGSGLTEEAGWKSVYCFELMDRAPPLNVKSELARFGVSWPEGARLAAGDWTNCHAALKALTGAGLSRDALTGLDH